MVFGAGSVAVGYFEEGNMANEVSFGDGKSVAVGYFEEGNMVIVGNSAMTKKKNIY